MSHELLTDAVATRPANLTDAILKDGAAVGRILKDSHSLPFVLAELGAKWSDPNHGADKEIRHYVLAGSGGRNEENRLREIAGRMEKILIGADSDAPAQIHVLTTTNTPRSSLLSTQSGEAPISLDPIGKHDPVRKILSYFDAELTAQGAPKNVRGKVILGSDVSFNAWVSSTTEAFNDQWKSIKVNSTPKQSISQTHSVGLATSQSEVTLDKAVELYYETRGASRLPFIREEPEQQKGTGSWNVRLTIDNHVLLQRANKKAFMLMDAQQLNEASGKQVTSGLKLNLHFTETGQLIKALDETIQKKTPAVQTAKATR